MDVSVLSVEDSMLMFDVLFKYSGSWDINKQMILLASKFADFDQVEYLISDFYEDEAKMKDLRNLLPDNSEFRAKFALAIQKSTYMKYLDNIKNDPNISTEIVGMFEKYFKQKLEGKTI